MRQSTRLIVNTLATFVRMALTVGIGLLTTRLQLKLLGVTDFGLFGAILATHFVSAMYAAALLTSMQRNLSYEIGLAEKGSLTRVFNSGVLLVALSVCAIFVLGLVLWPLIVHGLQMPASRIGAANWCYFTTLGTTAIAALTTPWQGLIAAHQELPLSGIIDVLSSVLRLAAVAILFLTSGDRLVTFAMTSLGAQILVAAALILLVSSRYPRARIDLRAADRPHIRRLLGFTGWTAAGNLAWSLRQNAAAVLVNLRFGPVANATFAVATQVATYAGNLSTAITRAIQPALVSMEAAGNLHKVQQLTHITAKYVFVLLSIPFVPLLIETPALLRYWLAAPPPDAIIVTRLTILWSLLASLHLGHDLAIQAHGRLRNYTLAVLVLSALALLVTAISMYFFAAGLWVVPLCTIALEIGLIALTVNIAGRLNRISATLWIRNAVAPALATVLTAAAICLLARESGIVDSAIVSALIYAICCTLAFWMIGLSTEEKSHFHRLLRRFVPLIPNIRDHR